MPLPSLPPQGSTNWYPWAQGVHDAAAAVPDKADASALDAKADLVGGAVPDAQLPSRLSDVELRAAFVSQPTTGTASATTYLRGDGSWATPAGGGGGAGLPSTVVNKTAAYTATAGDFVQADTTTAGFTVTLPSAPAVGALVAVKKVDSSANTLTIVPSGSGNIDGDPNATTTTKMAGAVFEHVGSDVWRITASMTTTGPAGPAGPTGATGATGPAGPGVPVGGATNQVLAKNSATDYDTAWVDQAAGGSSVPWTVNPATGEWMVSQLFLFNGNGSAAVGDMVFVPFLVQRSLTAAVLGCWINTAMAAGGLLRLGVYGSDTSGKPSSLLLDAGTVDGTTTGLKTITLGTHLALSPGLYWTVAVVQGTPGTGWTVRVFTGGTGMALSVGSSDLVLQTPAQNHFHQTAVTGALPATAAPVFEGNVSSRMAIVGLQAA